MRALLTRCHPALLFLGVVLAVAFSTYVFYRQQYAGATDWFGYCQQGQLLRQGRIALPLELPLREFPAAVPFGYFASGDLALPQYTPGFPLLLALAGLLQLEYFVNPVIGLLGCVLFFLLVRDVTGPWTAAVFTMLWAFFPIVVFSSTVLMSDMVAAVGLLAAWWLYRRERLLLSACVLGFSFSVRPTNVLFLLAFVLPLWRDRRLLRYGLWLALPCALYALYNQAVYGAPWRTGYSDIINDLQPGVFLSHFTFYLRETVRQLGWPLAGLALLGLTVPHRDRLFHVIWFVLFLGFYSFWWAGGDRWWWTRFLLPAYAPLFLLAALGFDRVRSWMLVRFPRPDWQPVLGAVLLGALALTPLYSIRLARDEGDVFVPHKGIEYFEVVRRIQLVAPPGSYVGSVEFGGALLLYSDLKHFSSVFENSLPLVREVLQRGRAAYLVVEPWHRDRDVILRLLAAYPHERLPDIPVWSGLQVYELHLPPVATP
jgi:hypothetical protein